MKTRLLANTARRHTANAALALGAALLAPLAPTRADDLYVVNNNNSTILKFTPAGASSVFASTYLGNPIDLALDSQGNLYVANYSAGNISKFTPGGIGSVFATTAFPSTLGLDGANPRHSDAALFPPPKVPGPVTALRP